MGGLAFAGESFYLRGMGERSKTRERPWSLQVSVPRSVLTAAAFVAFLSGAADDPAQAQDAGSKRPNPDHPRTASPAHIHHAVPHHVAGHHTAGHHPAHQHPAHGAAVHRDASGLVGLASWYDRRQRGLMTASGDLFDPDRLTAAHRSLPLGTRIRVTRIGTAESVTVVVNDRGPYIRDRVLDLSPAAAHALKTPAGEIVPVRIEILSLPQRTATR